MSVRHSSGVSAPPSRLRSIRLAITIQRRSPTHRFRSHGGSWMRPAGLLALLALLAPVSAAAQSEAADMARGNAARTALDMPAALAAYTAAIAADSTNATAYWKGALTLIDMGKLTPDSVAEPGAGLALRARRGAGAARRRARPEERRRVLRPGQRHRTRRADQEPEGAGAAGGGDPAGRPDGHRARPVARRCLSRPGTLERRDHAPVEHGALLCQVVHGRERVRPGQLAQRADVPAARGDAQA